MKVQSLALSLLALLALAACAEAPAQGTQTTANPPATSPTTQIPGFEEALVPGILASQGADGAELFSAPESVRAGEAFEVTVTTTGSGCERQGITSVIVTPASAAVMVYDYTTATSPDIACTTIFKTFSHTATLRFAGPGQASIQIWGRQVTGSTGPAGEPVVIERQITVNPAQ